MYRAALVLATGVVALGSVSAAGASPIEEPAHACVTAGGYVRVEATCGRQEQAVRLTVTPLASGATGKRAAKPRELHASRRLKRKSITGALIRPHSIPANDLTLPIPGGDIGSGINGRNIKRGSLPFSSLGASLKSTLESVVRQQIPAGATGPQGNVGPPGPAGLPVQLATSNFEVSSIPSDFSGFPPDEINLTTGPSRITTVDAPPSTDGHYLVSAVANVFSDSGQAGEFVACQLTTEPTPVAFGYFDKSFVGPIVAPPNNGPTPPLSNGLATLSMQWSQSLVPGTPVSLDCEDYAGSDAGIGTANLTLVPTN